MVHREGEKPHGLPARSWCSGQPGLIWVWVSMPRSTSMITKNCFPSLGFGPYFCMSRWLWAPLRAPLPLVSPVAPMLYMLPMIFPSHILVSCVLCDFLFQFHVTSFAKHSIPSDLALVFLKTLWTDLLPLWFSLALTASGSFHTYCSALSLLS